MATFQSDSAWGGARLVYSAPPYAVLTFSSELGWRGSPSTTLAERPTGLVRAFLASRLQSYDEANLASEVSFLYIVLSRAPQDNDATTLDPNVPFVEFGHGEFPAGPEDWLSEPLGIMLRRAIQELESP